MSLTFRVLAGFIVCAVAAIYLLLNPILDRVERQYLEATEEPMVDTAEILAAIVAREYADRGELPSSFGAGFAAARDREFEAVIYNLLKTRVSMGAYVTNASGKVVFDSDEPANVGRDFSDRQDVYLTLRGRYGARSSRTDESDDLSSVMFVGAPLLIDGKIVGVLSVYKPQRSLREFVLETKRWILFFGLSGTAAFLLFGFLLSRWVTHPLARLTRHAEDVTRGARPVPPRMPGRHLRVLGESVERMRDALEDRDYVGNYVQTLSHEMKAPVAAIRGAAELLDEDLPPEQRRRFMANIRSEAARLQKLIEQLLALASLESRKRLEHPATVDVAEIARRVVEESGEHYPDREIRLDAVGESIVSGDEFLLATAIRNLVQNAAEFSPDGGTIRVSVRRESTNVVVRIRDDGPGLPHYAKARVFERFYSLPRPGTERKSSGLGLCFVREAVALHGGTVALSNRAGATGAEATLTLPA